MDNAPISKLCHRRLFAELTYLRKEGRRIAAEELEAARAHGSLEENSQFDIATEGQQKLEDRISYLEARVRCAQVVDTSLLIESETVRFGTTVRVLDLNSGKEFMYGIFGPDEIKYSKSYVSIYSPLGRALLGKEVDDEVEVETPKELRELRILEILPTTTLQGEIETKFQSPTSASVE